MLIDLHTHSTASDGTQSPADLVAAAAAAGVDVLGLTDHDTTAGWDAAATAAAEHGVALVRGAELSCTTVRGISVHLLTYLHDPQAPGLVGEAVAARTSREHRARAIVELLQRDYALDWADVAAQSTGGATIGRPHIADALVARGHVGTRDEAFATILRSGSRYVVHHYATEAVDAVRLVRAAGGVPVLAHPAAAQRGRTVPERSIEAMAAAGLVGVEVDHRDHDDDARRRLRELAAALDLVVTGSSDYHGTGKLNRLGENSTAPASLERIEAAGTLPVLRG